MREHSEIYRSPPRLNADSLTSVSKHLRARVKAPGGRARSADARFTEEAGFGFQRPLIVTVVTKDKSFAC